MSDKDSDEDLFGFSGGEDDDTDDLMNASAGKAIAKKKSTPKKKSVKKSIPDADNDSDDEGLFDSDDEDDKKPAAKPKPKKKLKKNLKPKKSKSTSAAPPVDTSNLSKKERIELLRARKRDEAEAANPTKRDEGYDSGDSIASENIVRTKEDDDFIDVEGEDADAVKEYYAEQHFDDEPHEDMEEVKSKKGKGSSAKKRARGPDQLSDNEDMDNPIVAAVARMKKKKKVKKGDQECIEEAKEFVSKMEQAAIDDEAAIRDRRPGLNKLRMLPEVLTELTKVEMQRKYLDVDLLKVAKRWIQPLPDGSLGNITVRQKLLATIAKMSGKEGITTADLRDSDFGKLVMTLYMHKKETPELKRQHKNLIEQWSRIIFNKSGDMKNLSSAQAYRRGKDTGLTAIARSQAYVAAMPTPERSKTKLDSSDLGAVLANGKRSARDSGKNRVRVPYSKGFQFTHRPGNIVGNVTDKKTRITNVKEKRESLHKRMLEKNRPVSKNGRSANVSIEGRPTK